MLEIETLAHEIINPLNIIVGCAELSKLETKNTNTNSNNLAQSEESSQSQLSHYLDLILNQSKNVVQFLKNKSIIINQKNLTLKMLIKLLKKH